MPDGMHDSLIWTKMMNDLYIFFCILQEKCIKNKNAIDFFLYIYKLTETKN